MSPCLRLGQIQTRELDDPAEEGGDGNCDEPHCHLPSFGTNEALGFPRKGHLRQVLRPAPTRLTSGQGDSSSGVNSRTRLDSAERSNRFETTRTHRWSRQVAKLEIVFWDHYLGPSVAPAKPTGRTSALFQEGAHASDRVCGHLVRASSAAPERHRVTFPNTGPDEVVTDARAGYNVSMTRRAVAAIALACAAAAWSDAERSKATATTVSPLALVRASTPRFPVARYDTSGAYPQVRGGGRNLSAVNAALRAAVLADQRAYAPYARREKPRVAYRAQGIYRTTVDRRYLSASSVAVSALLPLTAEVFPGQPGGDRWLAMTVRVPSGTPVKVTDLFQKPDQGLRVLARAWKERIRRTDARPCLRAYGMVYSVSAANYRAFALTSEGITVGSPEVGACYRLVATVPYAVIRPYLSKLGSTLIAGVRRPR